MTRIKNRNDGMMESWNDGFKESSGFLTWMSTKITVTPINCRNSNTFIRE
jgi:hypothetical protein